MADDWFVQSEGREFGPLPDDQFISLAQKGKIKPDTKVRRNRFGNWVPAAKIRGLFPQAAAPDILMADNSRPTGRISNTVSDSTIRLEVLTVSELVESSESSEPLSARLVPCPDCGKRISKSATSCPNCGRPSLADQKEGKKNDDRRNSKSKPPLVRWKLAAVFGSLIAIVGLISAINEGGRIGSGSRSGGGSQTGGSSLRRDTPAAINSKVYSRLTDLAVAGDESGIESLMRAGLAVSLPKGTSVRIIDLGIFTSEIKVESGPYTDHYFIVSTENINR